MNYLLTFTFSSLRITPVPKQSVVHDQIFIYAYKCPHDINQFYMYAQWYVSLIFNYIYVMQYMQYAFPLCFYNRVRCAIIRFNFTRIQIIEKYTFIVIFVLLPLLLISIYFDVWIRLPIGSQVGPFINYYLIGFQIKVSTMVTFEAEYNCDDAEVQWQGAVMANERNHVEWSFYFFFGRVQGERIRDPSGMYTVYCTLYTI